VLAVVVGLAAVVLGLAAVVLVGVGR